MSWLVHLGTAVLLFVGGLFGFHASTPPASPAAQTAVQEHAQASTSSTQIEAPRRSSAQAVPPAPAKSQGVSKENAKTSASVSNKESVSAGSRSGTSAGHTEKQTWTVGTKWVSADSINGKQLKTAVTWPAGTGPFPVVILLHGSDGFRSAYVTLAETLSQSGFITVAPCWFTGFHVPGSHFSDYIDCSNAPTFTGANTDTLAYLTPLISYARNLPGSSGKIGIIGSSRGATMALLEASATTSIQAIVSISAIYESTPVMPGYAWVKDSYPMDFVKSLSAPVLILHGTGDSLINIQQAKDYVSQLSKLGKPFDSYYYNGAPHLLVFTAPYATDALSRAERYFSQYLK